MAQFRGMNNSTVGDDNIDLYDENHAIYKSNTLRHTFLVQAEIVGTPVEWDETEN